YGKTARPLAWFKTMKVRASTAAQYVITDARVKAIACGRRAYTDETSVPRPGFQVVDAVDSLEKWELENKVNMRYGTSGVNDTITNGVIKTEYGALAKAEVKEVDDPEKGKCLEITIESNPQHHKQMNEYAVIKLKQPITLGTNAHTVGLWVKGNSGWGRIFWEIEDATSTPGSWGGKYASSGFDYVARGSIDFDGWCFLSQPLTDQSPIPELSIGGLGHLWGSDPNAAKRPFKLTGLVFCAPAHPLYITEYKPCRQTIRVKNVSVLGD
ncbi:MAG: hypothetical protein GX608_09010, partial [Lentisphaerae bacterium]|nr:hypothetical protein [Lentisphaerota bacterium]